MQVYNHLWECVYGQLTHSHENNNNQHPFNLVPYPSLTSWNTSCSFPSPSVAPSNSSWANSWKVWVSPEHSLASACASNVFPTPGGPYSRTPLGNAIPGMGMWAVNVYGWAAAHHNQSNFPFHYKTRGNSTEHCKSGNVCTSWDSHTNLKSFLFPPLPTHPLSSFTHPSIFLSHSNGTRSPR